MSKSVYYTKFVPFSTTDLTQKSKDAARNVLTNGKPVRKHNITRVDARNLNLATNPNP